MSNFNSHTNPREPDEDDDEVDEASEESFPASDPPAWEPSHTGAPAPDPSPPNRNVEPDQRPE